MKTKKAVCVICNSSHSLLWRVPNAGYLCHLCYAIEEGSDLTANAVPRSRASVNMDANRRKAETSSTSTASTSTAKPGKKGGNRWTRSRNNATAGNAAAGAQGTAPKAKEQGRRTLFKKPPSKSPIVTATIVTSDSIYYNGLYMQAGDIVSMIDENGDTYYAQIRCFSTDKYFEKSAVVTWLLPTTASPPPSQSFDPATYISGPDEYIPRKLEYMEFIMHAPPNYYKCNNTPYPPMESEVVAKATSGFIWTSMDAKDRS